MVMDDTKLELLMSAVQSRALIWQNNHPKHHDPHVLSPLWKEIESLLKEDKEDCRKKWKGLVTLMKKKLRLVPKARSGDAASTYKSKWKWFESMQFISNYAKERESAGNLDEVIAADDAEQEEQLKQGVQLSKSPRQQIPSLDIKENVAAASNDEAYFRTILSYVTKISPEQKLQFRSQVFRLVHKYAYPDPDPEEEKKRKRNDDDEVTLVDWRIHPQNRLFVKREPLDSQLDAPGTYDRGLESQDQGYNYLNFARYSTQAPALMEPGFAHPLAGTAVFARANLYSHRVNMEEDEKDLQIID